MGQAVFNVSVAKFGLSTNDQTVIPANETWRVMNHPDNRTCKLSYVAIEPHEEEEDDDDEEEDEEEQNNSD